MSVLVVACGAYGELGGGFDVPDAREAGAAVARELGAAGIATHTLRGKVTERRLARALGGLGKAARRGEQVGLVLLGHRLGGSFAVENTVVRAPGRRLRTFSARRVGALLGARAFDGDGFLVGDTFVPLVVVAPGESFGTRGFDPGGGTWGADDGPDWRARFDAWRRRLERLPGGRGFDIEELKKAARSKFQRPQIDPGSDGLRWTRSGGTMTFGSAGPIALVEMITPNESAVLGLLELHALTEEGTQHEIWRFANSHWPNGDFKLRRLLSDPSNTTGRWQQLTVSAAAAWPIATELDWKGFVETSTPTTLQTAFTFARPTALHLPVVYARTTVGPLPAASPVVTGWFGRGSKSIDFRDGVILVGHSGPHTLPLHHATT